MITEDTVLSDEVEIAAPIELVWAILIDFESYGKWNTFCSEIVNRALAIGESVEMSIDLGRGPQKQVEYIRRIEPNEAIAWGMENKPGDPIHALRTQTLTKTGEASCRYVSIDEFSGEAKDAMLASFGKPIEDGFNRCAYELRRYAEERYASESARGDHVSD